tara:strand:- start:489 stop:962 length:474 start_codon:yes stop_codon:yes gene_type:complete
MNKNKINTSNKIYKRDIKSGEKNEKKVFEYLNATIYKDEPLEKSSDKYAVFDFFSKSAICELKSRNNIHSHYRSTMVGFNKIDYANKMLEDLSESVLVRPEVVFYFLFQDGLYSWNLDNNQYYTKQSGREDRGQVEKSKYAYINISNLELITKDICS